MHNIIIKTGSRCCSEHFEKGNKKDNHFLEIPTIDRQSTLHLLPTLQVVSKIAKEKSNQTEFLFQRFNDLDLLEDKECLKITGWNKDNF